MRALCLFVAASVCAVGVGCESSTSTIVVGPITGIIVRGQDVVPGTGCGTRVDQVFRYAVVVRYANPNAIASMGSSGPWSNIAECFSDAVFENLPSATASSDAGGELDFDVTIYAYNLEDYQKAMLPAADGGDLGCPPSSSPADACTPAITPLTAEQIADATWTQSCTATEQAGVPVLAVCSPPDGGPILDAAADSSFDATVDAQVEGMDAADAAADATGNAPDAPPDAPSDAAQAPEGSTTDASTDGGAPDASEPSDG
jgi:hypothetical protein